MSEYVFEKIVWECIWKMHEFVFEQMHEYIFEVMHKYVFEKCTNVYLNKCIIIQGSFRKC